MKYNIKVSIDGETITATMTDFGFEAAALGLEFNPRYFVDTENNTSAEKLKKVYRYISEMEQAALRRTPLTEREENNELEQYGIKFIY